MSHALRAALVGLLALAACGETGAPALHGIDLQVAALLLEAVDDVCYDVRVDNREGVVWAAGDPLVTRLGASQVAAPGAPVTTMPDRASLCASDFGDGASLAYVAPCDASSDVDDTREGTQNRVTIWVDGLYRAGADVADWQDPCPSGCAQLVDCSANRDTPARFDLTLVRDAQQGFFDVAVAFEDIFCSAKLDTCYADGGALTLLFGADDVRDHSAVFGLACAAGADDSVTLMYGVVHVGCASGDVFLLDVAAAGEAAVVSTTSTRVLHYGVYRHHESVACGPNSCAQSFWNVALSLDDLAAVGGSCGLALAATARGASTTFTAGMPSAAGLVYPYIAASATLTSGGVGGCQRRALNDASEVVRTVYRGAIEGLAAPPVMCLAYDGTSVVGTGAPVDDCGAPSVVTCEPDEHLEGSTCVACTPIAHCLAGLGCTSASDATCGECEAGYTPQGNSCVAEPLSIIGLGTVAQPRTWSNGTLAASCEGYRRPGAPKTYSGATGSAIYRIDPGNGVIDVYCDMVADGGGWTLVVDINGSTNAHGNTTGAYGGALTTTSGAAKLADATINLLSTIGYWRYSCGVSVNVFVRNSANVWVSAVNNGYDWRIDRGRDGTFEDVANRSGYVFSSYPFNPPGHSNYAATSSAEGTGCYVDGEGWGRSGNLWAR